MFKALHGFFAALGTVGVFAYIGLLIAGIVGYVMNIIDLVQLCLVPGPLQVTGLLIGRIIGLFIFPVGGILGYF